MKPTIKHGNDIILTQHLESIEIRDDVGERYDASQHTSWIYAHYYVVLRMTSGKTYTFMFGTREERETFIMENLT